MEEKQLYNKLLNIIEQLKVEDNAELRKQASNCLYSLLIIDPIKREYNELKDYLTAEDIFKYINYAFDNKDNFPFFVINGFDLSSEGELFKNNREEVLKIYQKLFDLYKNDKTSLFCRYSFTDEAIQSIDPLFPVKKDISVIQDEHFARGDFRFLRNHIDEIFDYCIENNVIFTKKYSLFLQLCDVEKIITTANLDESIADTILSMTKDDPRLISLFIDKYPNYAANLSITIDVCNLSLEESIELIKKIRSTGNEQNIYIITNKISNEEIDKVLEASGENLRIRAYTPNSNHSAKYFEPEDLKRRNDEIDIYANALKDRVGPNGEIKSLSPFEKMVAAYIIDTNFASYLKADDPNLPRSVFEFIDILDDRPIVCVGYVSFIDEVLSRNDFKNIGHWLVKTNTPDLSGASSDKESALWNHDVLYSYLVDDKYGIEAFFLSDPTADSIPKGSTPKIKDFSHCLRSFDQLSKDTFHYDDPIKDMGISEEKINNFGKEYLNVENLFEKFKREITTDEFIKAICAIHRFTDKNLSMAKTNDVSETGYTVEEYNKTALSIGQIDSLIYDDALFDKSFLELYNYFIEEYGMEEYGSLGLMSRMLDKYNFDKRTFFKIDNNRIELLFWFSLIDFKDYSEEECEKIYDHFGESAFANFPIIQLKLLDFDINDKFSSSLIAKEFDLDSIIKQYQDEAYEAAKGEKRTVAV